MSLKREHSLECPLKGIPCVYAGDVIVVLFLFSIYVCVKASLVCRRCDCEIELRY